MMNLFFGNQILVCPILEPNAVGRRMYLPRGIWYNYWTNEVIKGGKEIWVDTKFDEIPILWLVPSFLNISAIRWRITV
jgi:alpha-glucosidase (family GH31 glycosyl hydrolase)